MYNIVISNYEEREKEIMVENAGLRGFLQDFCHLIAQKIDIGLPLVSSYYHFT